MAKCQKCDSHIGVGQIRCPVCGHVRSDDGPAPVRVCQSYAFGALSSFCLAVAQFVSALGLIATVIAWCIAPFQGQWLAFFVVIPLGFVLGLGSFYMFARVRAMKGLLQGLEEQLEKQEQLNCSRFAALVQAQK